jgi:hypothetical protein
MTIIETIKRCADLLASVGEEYWSSKLSALAEAAPEPLSANEVEEILSWYGGMGSFSDMLISSINDHDVQPEQEDELNAQLSELRSAIYSDAMEAKLSFRP